ncbi:11204_t:CDS:2, partial [Acaulospora morrowiae]
FAYVSPPANGSSETVTIKNGDDFNFSWKKDSDSDVTSVTDVELFLMNDKNATWLGVIWNDGIKFSGDSASAKVKVAVPSGTSLPNTFKFRSWANTAKGPNCIAFSVDFKITQ